MSRTPRSYVEILGVVLIWMTVISVVAILLLRSRTAPTERTSAASDSIAPVAAAVAPNSEVARVPVTIDPQRQQLLGVRLAPARRETLSREIRTTGVVRYDETRQTDINVKLDGWVRELHADYTGQFVNQGQPLFSLYSPDLLAAQREYLLALKTREQMHTATLSEAREFAGRMEEAAKQKLELWDLSQEEIARLASTSEPQEAVTFRSPSTGFVVEKSVVRGMHVNAGQTLYKVADLSSVWVEADLHEQELADVRINQRAAVTFDAYPGETYQGRASYIYPFVDDKSRTAKVRFQLPNSRLRLKPGMYAAVVLRGTQVTAVTVPANAVINSGKEHIVFVSSGEGTFTPRPVEVGRQFGDRMEVVAGLKEGEEVAESATFFLDSESQLRAGLQNYEPTAPPQSDTSTTALDIAFRSQPDPPKTGESVFEVVVKDASGRPVTDAEIAVQQFMPAMPTMNMPAMRTEAKLPHSGAGVYRGPAQVMMAGRWDVTVTATRRGQPPVRKQFAIVAR